MRRILILAIFLFYPLSCATAQDSVFNAPEIETKTIDEALGLTTPKTERKSTGNEKKDLAIQYYEDCVKHDHQVLDKEGQDLLCACTSNGIEQTMSVEDIKAMYETSPKSTRIRDNMMLNIYASCTKYPIKNMVYDGCMQNKDLQKSMPDYKSICKCSADTMARFMNVHAKEIVQGALQTPAWYADPIGSYLMSEGFERKSYSYLELCVKIYVRGSK